jgi:anti-sigma-K factor RskA
MLSENHLLELIPGYALDCLSEQDMLLVSEHLSQCSSCRVELDSYLRIVNDLYLAVPEVAPPPDLKQKVLGNIPEKRARAAAKQPVSAWLRLRSLLRTAAPVWAYASMVLIVILAAGNLWFLQRLNRLEATTSSDFRVVTLAGTDMAPDASGMLVMSHDGNLGTLVVDGLQTLDQAHQYQLWLIHDGSRDSGGVFSVSKEGYGALTVAAEQPLNIYSALGITVEPRGGSPGPTGEKVMGGSL